MNTHIAISTPGKPGYHTIASDTLSSVDLRENLKLIRKAEKRGDAVHRVTREEAVRGMREWCDHLDSAAVAR